MNKEMIISSSDLETRVAILEDDQVVELFIERERQRGVVGNIYKGRVSKVLPGMQSSFVDVGLERDAFLYVSEVVNTVEEFERLESGDEDEDDENGEHIPAPVAAPVGALSPDDSGVTAVLNGRVERRGRTTAIARSGSRAPAAEDRRPAQGRPGSPGAGRQGTARHEGRAAHVPRDDARPVPGVHADGRPRRRLPQDRFTRRAGPPPRHRPRVPRTARLHRRRHHPHGRLRPLEGRHRQRPVVLPPGLDRDPSADGEPSSAGAVVPGAEPRHQAPPRPAHRRLFGHPHRQRAGAPARDFARRAHHAEPAAAGEAVHEGLPDLRGIRGPGRDRQGAAQQGLAEVRRLPRHQSDGSARRHRRQHRALRRQAHRDASRTRSSRPTWKRSRRSCASSGFAIWAASSCST